MNWLITDKGDPDARRLVDGEGLTDDAGEPVGPHYSRRKWGNAGKVAWTRSGQNLPFVTADGLAVWNVHRPDPSAVARGLAARLDHRDAWECTMFRNLGAVLSSTLIREAVLLTVALWGPLPKDGLLTYVDPEEVRSGLPGYCFRRAGWRRIGTSADGARLLFRAPSPASVPSWTAWAWKDSRGGKLRRALEGRAA